MPTSSQQSTKQATKPNLPSPPRIQGGKPMTAARIDLNVGGMTCASCANRVEKKLNRMPGVEAFVNYATEKATIFAEDGIAVADLIATVEKTGYSAQVPEQPTSEPAAEAADPADVELASLRQRMKIGRASCRERGEERGGGGAGKRVRKKQGGEST